MACDYVDLEGLCQVAVFPVLDENQTTAIMLIGHKGLLFFPEELLSIYQGVAGLAGETVTRIHNITRLRKHSEQLHQLIASNSDNLNTVTKDLNEANIQLTEEIAQRKRIEQALQEAEQEKSAILNGLQEVEVLLLDPEMRIIWTNAGASLPADRQADDFRGRYCYKAFRADCPLPWLHGHGGLWQRAIPGRGNYTARRPVDAARSNPLKNEQGKVTSVVHVAMDITGGKWWNGRSSNAKPSCGTSWKTPWRLFTLSRPRE